ncbi:MAG: hypothetical protein QOG14_3450, partial [Mycobacterium sp.]|nr:hypothetical protein [Mycobacterium sp.]
RLWIRLCAKLLILCRQPLASCTTATSPQPLHTNHTTQPRVMHNAVGSPAAQTSCCPQLAQALLLLLKYLQVSSLENGTGDRPFHTPVSTRESAECRRFRLAFKMGSDALRLWFDCRFGRRNGLPARASVGGEYRASRGGGAADVGLAARGDEGTQWTWRRPQSA